MSQLGHLVGPKRIELIPNYVRFAEMPCVCINKESSFSFFPSQLGGLSVSGAHSHTREGYRRVGPADRKIRPVQGTGTHAPTTCSGCQTVRTAARNAPWHRLHSQQGELNRIFPCNSFAAWDCFVYSPNLSLYPGRCANHGQRFVLH